MASPRRSVEPRPRSQDGAALIKHIANGDESAFATFYDTTSRLIYGLLLRILGNSAAAQQVLVAVYQ
jgi:RNA polymerase sigma-70 factor (ECF subfamily)